VTRDITAADTFTLTGKLQA
jgi:hypothetical protein